jgi:hypothetical protein
MEHLNPFARIKRRCVAVSVLGASFMKNPDETHSHAIVSYCYTL